MFIFARFKNVEGETFCLFISRNSRSIAFVFVGSDENLVN